LTFAQIDDGLDIAARQRTSACRMAMSIPRYAF